MPFITRPTFLSRFHFLYLFVLEIRKLMRDGFLSGGTYSGKQLIIIILELI